MQPDFLPRSFFDRPTQSVARELLGCRLIRKLAGTLLVGAIVETEAYIGQRDLACHAKVGKTPRTRIMYGPPGLAYVYFTYGMHWMLNLVTEAEGFPAAVLIRAIQPLEGISCMQDRRGGKPLSQLANGPAKLTQALGIAREQNGLDCCRPDSPLTLAAGAVVPPILGGGHAPHRPGPDSRALAVQAVALRDSGERVCFEVRCSDPVSKSGLAGKPRPPRGVSRHFSPQVALLRRVQGVRVVFSVILERQCVPGRCHKIAAYAAVAAQNPHDPGLTPGAKCCRGYAAL